MKADIKRIYRHAEVLTMVQPARNFLNVQSLEEIAEYISSEFSLYGLQTTSQYWEVDGRRYRNIIALYNPSKAKRLVVGAHYDVCGDQPGADDNASAVAGLLETARLVALNKPDLDYCLEFVAYCLEEPPYFATEAMGSFVHAQSLYKEKVDVIGMICYEMIGYFDDTPGSQQFPDPSLKSIYPDKGNFIIVVGIDAQKEFAMEVYGKMRNKAFVDVQSITFSVSAGLAGLSDQRNYWHFGYNAVMINDTSFMRNPHYHLESDTIDTLNFEKLTEVVNACYYAVTGF
ncbi:MAG: M28 family peptidase [Cytophagaceae bacterium]